MDSTPTTNPPALLAYLKQDTTLTSLLADPAVQQSITALLAEEQRYQYHQRHYQNRSSSGRPHSSNNSKSAGFPNPNSAPLSPLEKKIIEGTESTEQQALRLLLKDILEA